MTHPLSGFRVEPEDESGGHCDCCGSQTRRVWGFVYHGEAAVACYCFSWTVGQSLETHQANFDLIYGRWGDGATAQDRYAISLVHFIQDGKPAVSVIDANSRPLVAESSLVRTALRREDVIGTPLATTAFNIFDAVITLDTRLN